MTIIDRLPVWKRLVLLVSVALLGLLVLIALVYLELGIINRHSQSVAEQVPAVRSTQRIVLRALEARVHLALALQHNPDQPEIMKLHAHELSFHIDGARKAFSELKEAVDQVRKSSHDAAVEHAALLQKIDQAIDEFDDQGIKPMVESLAAAPPRFFEANVRLLKQTNPAYEKLRKSATELSDAITASAESKHAAMSAAFRETTTFIIIIGLLDLVLCVVVGIWITRSILRQIGGEPALGKETMQKVAAGDLAVTVQTAHQDSMLGALASMVGNLANMIRGIRSNAHTLKGSAGEIRHSMENVVGSANSQADATASVAASIEQLTVSINHIADSVRETEEHAEHSATEAEQGKVRAAKVVEVMQLISKQLSDTSGQIRALEGRSHEISSIAAVIKDIADQTNLLALNAAIEAARAGESGRGFAVVADEVRKLAERTSTATGDIEKMIATIQTETHSAVSLMESSMPKVAESVSLVEESRAALEIIHNGANSIFSRVREVSDATREQSLAATAIAQQVENIAQNAEEASAAAKTTAAAVATVEQQASELEAEVARFKV